MKVRNLLILGLSLVVMASCGKKANQEDQEVTSVEETTIEKEVLQPRTETISLYEGEAVTGDDADYIGIDLPAGDSIELNASPAEDYGSPKFRVRVPLKVNKKFNKGISYLRIKLELLDENNEQITTLSINDADKETLIAALTKGKLGPVTIGFDTPVLDSYYTKYLDKAKYYRITDVEIDDDSPSSSTSTSSSSSSSSSTSSSSSSSSYDDDYDDYDDDGDGKETKMSKAKKKVKETYEKAKETYNDKYKDKVDDAKEKIKDKWNDLWD